MMKIVFKRLIAAVIDMYIICFVSSLIVLFVTLGRMNVTILSVASYLLSVFLLAFLKDIFFKNQSIGKRIFKLVIIKADGTRFSLTDSLKRALTLILLPLEVVLVITNNHRIGDMWAKTTVVSKRGNTGDSSGENTGDGSVCPMR